MITVNVDTRQLERKIAEKALAMKQPLQDVLKDEGRLLAVALCKYTQPFGLDEEARKKGQGAITRDYRRVYPALASQFILDKVGFKARPKDKEAAANRIAQYVREGNVQAIMTMLGDMKIARQGKTADPQYHTSRWSNGKLKGGVSQIVPDQKSVEQLIDQAKALSGFAKSGWATVAGKLGGTRGIPAWARNGKAPGQVIDKTGAEKPSITLVNQINYTDRVLSQTAQAAAIRERRTKIQLSIERAVKFGVKDK